MYKYDLTFNTFPVLGLETDQLIGDSSAVDMSIQYLIQHHPELESFRIKQSSSCSNSSLKALFSHQNIIIIELGGSELITGEILYPNSEVKPKLKVLNLSLCRKLTDIGVVGLLNLTDGETLIELDLQYTDITLNNIEDLNINLSKLEVLILDGCNNVTDTGTLSLLNRVGCELKTLGLTETKITLDNIGDLATRFSKMEHLFLSTLSNVTDAGTISLLNRVGGELKTLELSDTNITLDNIGDLNTTLLKLENLGLNNCDNITDTGTISLLNRVGGELKTLELAFTNITLDNIGDLATRFSKMENLDFGWCSNITDAGTLSLLNRVGHELKTLNLSSTNISLDNIGDLNTTFPKLRTLDLSECDNITEAGVISLLNKVGDGVEVYIARTPVSSANTIRDQFPSVTLIGESV